MLVDAVLDGDCIFLVVSNVGDRPALDVRVTFDPALRGLGGTCDIGALSVFHRLAFLGPGRDIPVLLDSSAAWFARDEPTEFRADVAWRDEDEGRGQRSLHHDLSIYRDLPNIPGHPRR